MGLDLLSIKNGSDKYNLGSERDSDPPN